MFDTTSPTLRKQILALFTNRWAMGCLGILLFQQMWEASATYWLVKLMQSVTLGENFYPYFFMYISAVALPYIPLCIAYILKITWKQEAQRSFINTFVSSNRNNIGEWSNKGLKEEKLSFLTAEGPAAITALIDYVWDLYTYVLSVFFNIAALSIVVEPLFAVAYGFSITVVIIVMKLKRRAQRQLTKKALTARIDLNQSLLAAWDNVLLGNDYNFKLWEEKTTQRIQRCLRRNIDLERFDQFLAIAVLLITSIPTMFVVIHHVIVNQSDAAKLSSFIVILPLLFIIMTYTYQTLTLAFRWAMHKSKLLQIYKAIQGSKVSQTSMEKKIKWPKIYASQTTRSLKEPKTITIPKTFISHQDFMETADKSGRITMRGENGSGKSTALMLMKNALNDRAFFLPTQNQLSFLSETNKHSTGESLRNRLVEILEKVDVDVLLLDEWDANLDPENQEQLSTLIDTLAAKKCVIEVRHR